jgi:hypothetical protein
MSRFVHILEAKALGEVRETGNTRLTAEARVAGGGGAAAVATTAILSSFTQAILITTTSLLGTIKRANFLIS